MKRKPLIYILFHQCARAAISTRTFSSSEDSVSVRLEDFISVGLEDTVNAALEDSISVGF